ncbi:hypothetical protein [Faecalimicrobium sp. JNUCC 81]
MKKVIIAEKSSLETTIVQSISGSFEIKDGYLENGDYIVTIVQN